MSARRSRLARGALPSALLVLLGATSACVPASPDTDTYADQAVTGLGTVLSEVATTQQVLELLETTSCPAPRR